MVEAAGGKRVQRGRGARRASIVAIVALSMFLVGPASPANPTFVPAPGSPFAVGTNPHSLAVADFNGDGKLDLAVAEEGPDSVSILLGNGAGGFALHTSVPVGTDPLSVAAGHLNGDGKIDLAVANAESDNVSILLGNGSGGFTPAGLLPAGDGSWWVTISDLDRDGDTDLTVSNVFADSVSVFLGNGSGAFTPVAPVPVGSFPYANAVADVNGDGDPDLVVANQFAATVSVLLGNGAGGFVPAPGSPIAVGSGPSWVVLRDLDGDGDRDLVVTNQGSDTVSILLGDGAGGFSPAPGSPLAAGNGPTPVVVTDLSLDGELDLAVGNILSDNLSIFVGDGNAGFAAAPSSPVAVGDFPFSVAAGDFNGDGKPDLAAANYGSHNVSVLLNTTPSAADLIEQLSAEVSASTVKKDLKKKLLKELDHASRALERTPPKTRAACKALDKFVDTLEKTVGKKGEKKGLTAEQAAGWIAAASEIQDALDCADDD